MPALKAHTPLLRPGSARLTLSSLGSALPPGSALAEHLLCRKHWGFTGEQDRQISVLGSLDLAGDRHQMGDYRVSYIWTPLSSSFFPSSGGRNDKKALRGRTRDPAWECFQGRLRGWEECPWGQNKLSHGKIATILQCPCAQRATCSTKRAELANPNQTASEF